MHKTVQCLNSDAGQSETLARLVVAGALSTHTLTLTVVELQVCVLLCAAKALCGLLKRRLFGRNKVCKRRLLLVKGV